MSNKPLFQKIFIITLSISFSLLLQSGITSAANNPNETDEGVEVLTRGPIHEAFADVSVDELQSGAVISRPVPEPINEVPPEFRPEGDQITWIPGYWSWDEDQDDYIWVSGVWRDVPPGRQWIPGYWLSIEGGNQYISGYWAESVQSGTRTEYLPPPPEPPAVGPSSPATASDYMWIEGSWIWSSNGYAWQAGYWQAPRPNMIWVPAHYIWTPRGSIFVMGYWDYQLGRRGMMFAPLHYPRPIYRNHGYFYTPHIVLDIDAVFLSLFIRTNSRHYYFGDYYDPRYEKRGFRPWYSKHATRYGYDPYYRSYRLNRLRHDRNWENNYHQQFQYRRDHKDARPPRVYRLQEKHNYIQSHQQAKHQIIGRRLSDIAVNKAYPVRLTHIRPDNKRTFQIQEQNKKLKNFQIERRNLEKAPYPERKRLQPTDTKKPLKITPTAAPYKPRSKSEKVDSYVKPQNKSQINQRVQAQEQPKDLYRADQQKKQHLRTQTQSKKQTQVIPQEKQYQKPQERKQNQPQVIPAEKQQRRAVERTNNQPQALSQREKGRKVQERTQNQPQVKPVEKQQRRAAEQANTQSQPPPQREKGRKLQEQTEDRPQGSPREKRFSKQQWHTEDLGK